MNTKTNELPNSNWSITCDICINQFTSFMIHVKVMRWRNHCWIFQTQVNESPLRGRKSENKAYNF